MITTHYIEEARQANVVGMMRFGKLLAEDSPTKLLQRYELPTLEDVFLNLCHKDETERGGDDLQNGPLKPVPYMNILVTLVPLFPPI